MYNHPKQAGINAETVIIIIVIVVFIGGTVVSFIARSPILTALGAGTTVTALLYRFLGGVGGSTFKFKAFKATGSVAVLAAVTLFVNSQLEEQFTIVDPSIDNWVAMDKSGVLIPVKIGQKHNAPDSLFLIDTIWRARLETGKIRVTSSENHPLASIGFQSLETLGLFNDISIEMLTGRGIRFSGELTAGRQEDLSPYPYAIRTEEFVDSYNTYSVLDTKGKVIRKGSLRSKDVSFFRHEGKHFMIFVSRAVHNDPENLPFAVFGFGQFKISTSMRYPR